MRIRIGTRSSALALAQTSIVIKYLTKILPELEPEIVKIKTTGDILYKHPLTEIGGKALFIKEIEEALIEGHIDIAVHSMKDMPALIPKELTLACVLPRDDVADVFLSKKYPTLLDMPTNSRLGTCSSRRKMLVNRFNSGVLVEDLRGNVTSRIEKLNSGSVDAIILAAAGLQRLKLDHLVNERLDTELFIPAVAQGAICVECRNNNEIMLNILRKINDIKTYIETAIERVFLRKIGGNCKVPLGAYAFLADNIVSFNGFLGINGDYIFYYRLFKLDEIYNSGELKYDKLETLIDSIIENKL